MNNEYNIKFTERAVEDLDSVYSYIKHELKSVESAVNTIDKIEQSILKLKEFPYLCSYVNDFTLKQKGYRKLVIKNYLAFYLVNEEEKTITIMAIIYGCRDYLKLL